MDLQRTVMDLQWTVMDLQWTGGPTVDRWTYTKVA